MTIQKDHTICQIERLMLGRGFTYLSDDCDVRDDFGTPIRALSWMGSWVLYMDASGSQTFINILTVPSLQSLYDGLLRSI